VPLRGIVVPQAAPASGRAHAPRARCRIDQAPRGGAGAMEVRGCRGRGRPLLAPCDRAISSFKGAGHAVMRLWRVCWRRTDSGKIAMTHSDVQEMLFSLYLRLNGFFVTGFIVHGSWRNKTEMDALAVRFPHHREPEREIGTSQALDISDSVLDFLVCEVKGGIKPINFNPNFRNDPDAIMSVLNRIGAFSEQETRDLVPSIKDALRPECIQRSQGYPTIPIASHNSRLRFILVAPEQTRRPQKPRSYIYGDDMISYIWNCFRPGDQRERCADRYNFELWRGELTRLVNYFKDRERSEPGQINSIYNYFDLPARKQG
jgi:hypothetical protein